MDNPLLARYAECIFWLARFVERSENLARILEVNETYGRDRSGVQNWLSIVELNADETFFAAKHAQATADNVIRFYLTDAENATSIVSAIGNARENARALRPLVSTEMWVALNMFHNRLKTIAPHELAPGNLNRLLTEIKEACQTFTGITEGTFYRDQAWSFFRLGRYIERADQTTRLLDTKYRLLTGEAASGRGGRPMARAIAFGLGLSRLPPGAYEPSDSAAGGRLSAVQPELSALGYALRARDRPGARRVALAIRGAPRRRGRRVHRRAARNPRKPLDRADSRRDGLHDFIDFLQSAFIELTSRLSAAFFGIDATPRRESSRGCRAALLRHRTMRQRQSPARIVYPVSVALRTVHFASRLDEAAHSPSRHDLPLSPAGIVRRASHDAPATRQL